jgi:electron transfer flavoprotein alpha subunit
MQAALDNNNISTLKDITMSVLIFLDNADGHVRKASLEAASYGAAIAKQLGTTAEGIILGKTTEDLSSLGKYGLSKVHTVANDTLNSFDAQVYTKVIAEAAAGADVIIFSNNVAGKALAPRLSVRLKAGLVTGAVALPDTSNGFVVKKNVFSGKAFANIAINTAKKIIALNPNSYSIAVGEGTAEVVAFNASVDAPKVQVTATSKVEGDVPLTEAEVVVSGGRGLKARKTGDWLPTLPKCWEQLQPVAAQWQMCIGAHTTSMWGKRALPLRPICISPLVFPAPYSIWQVLTAAKQL